MSNFSLRRSPRGRRSFAYDDGFRAGLPEPVAGGRLTARALDDPVSDHQRRVQLLRAEPHPSGFAVRRLARSLVKRWPSWRCAGTIFLCIVLYTDWPRTRRCQPASSTEWSQLRMRSSLPSWRVGLT
jgi:hypothetical protein